MKIEVGKKYRMVKDFVKVGCDFALVHDMLKWQNKVVTVRKICVDGGFLIEEDVYTWSTNMIECEVKEMNPKQLRERIAEIEKECAELKKQLDDASFPKIGDQYYLIETDMESQDYRFHDDSFDKKMVKIGNIFRTKEEAEAMAEKIKKLLKGEE